MGNTLGQHIEIPYSMGMFSSNHDSMNQPKVSLLPQNNSSITTNLDESVAKSSRTKDAPKRKRKRAPRNNVFDSIDFNNFLQQKLLKSSDSANGILKSSDFSLFKSKESFVSGFLSKDWGTNPSTKALHADSSGKLPTTVDSARVQSLTTVPNDHLSNDSKSMIQKSQDWMKFNTLGQHIEIPYSMGMFSSNHDSMNQSKVSLL